ATTAIKPHRCMSGVFEVCIGFLRTNRPLPGNEVKSGNGRTMHSRVSFAGAIRHCVQDADIVVRGGRSSSPLTDRAPSSPTVRSPSLTHRGVRLDPLAVPAAVALEMATIGGARALRLDHLIGSLEVGKRADLAIIDLDEDNLVPLYDPASHLAYAVEAADCGP